MDELPPDPSVDPDLSLTKKGSKAPLAIVGLLVAGTIGFFVFASMKKQDERKRQAAFMQSFQDIEKGEVGKFWACLLGDKIDAASIPDNLALSARIEGAFMTDPKTFPARVREDCTPKAIDAK